MHYIAITFVCFLFLNIFLSWLTIKYFKWEMWLLYTYAANEFTLVEI